MIMDLTDADSDVVVDMLKQKPVLKEMVLTSPVR